MDGIKIDLNWQQHIFLKDLLKHDIDKKVFSETAEAIAESILEKLNEY